MRALIPFVFLAVAGCSSLPSIPYMPAIPFTGGAEEEGDAITARHGNVWLAGQPSEAQIARWAEDGAMTVINIRTEPEIEALSFDEEAAVGNAGMSYVTTPVGGDHGYTPATTMALSGILEFNEDPVVLHCGSGFRAAHVYAAYLIETYQIAPSEVGSLGLLPDREFNPDRMRQLSPRYAAAYPAVE